MDKNKLEKRQAIYADDVLLCAVCGGNKKVEVVDITNCNLCKKCRQELSDSFESVMTMDRSDYPDL